MTLSHELIFDFNININIKNYKSLTLTTETLSLVCDRLHNFQRPRLSRVVVEVLLG